MGDDFQTDFLVPNSTLLTGLGSIVCVFGCEEFRYNISETPSQADAKALMSDWKIVGDDIVLALSRFEQDISQDQVKHSR